MAEAETQTPPSVRDLRRSLIDYNNALFHPDVDPTCITFRRSMTQLSSSPVVADRTMSTAARVAETEDRYFGLETRRQSRCRGAEIIDYSNRLQPCSGGPTDLVPLDTLTSCVTQDSGQAAVKDDDDSQGPSSHNGSAVGGGMSTTGDKKTTNKLCSSLLVRGRHAGHASKKKGSAPGSMSKTKTQDTGGELKQSRNGIFVLLGLAD